MGLLTLLVFGFDFAFAAVRSIRFRHFKQCGFLFPAMIWAALGGLWESPGKSVTLIASSSTAVKKDLSSLKFKKESLAILKEALARGDCTFMSCTYSL